MRYLLLMWLLCGASSIGPAGKALEPISLLKREEFYLRINPTPEEEEGYLKNPSCFSWGLRFVCSRNGRAAFYTWRDIHSFDEEHNITKTFGGLGWEPGKFLRSCLSITLSEDSMIAATGSRRVNIFNDRGDFVRSFIIPDYRTSPYLARIYKDLLIVGLFYQKDPIRIHIYDCIAGKPLARFFTISEEDQKLLEEKGAAYFPHVRFTISTDGTLLCNRMDSYRIHEYDLKGDLIHTYDELPPHYIPLAEAEPFDIDSLRKISDWRVGDKMCEEWEATWSPSGCPSLYGEDVFIVPRRTVPPIYLDFYSLESRSYLGYCQTDKHFLFSDSEYIYLCEDFDGTMLTVGKYEAVVGQQSAAVEEIVLDSLPSGSRERLFKETADETTTAILNSMDGFRIRDLDGNDQSVSDYLSSNKHHLVAFIRPFDCGFIPGVYEEVKEFVKHNKDYDFWVIVSHPFEEELRLFINGLELEVPVLPNLAVRRLRNLSIERTPDLLVVDTEGEIIYAKGETVSEFLNRVKGEIN